MDPTFRRESLNIKSYPAPPRGPSALTVSVVVPEEKRTVVDGPSQVGSVVPVPSALIAKIGAAQSGAPSSWSAMISAPGASRLRAQLNVTSVTAGTIFWVTAGESGESVGFEIGQPGITWSPSVRGDTIRVVAETRSGTVFSVEAVAIIRAERDAVDCYLDATCFTEQDAPGIDMARAATAHLSIIKNGGVYICSGALIADQGTVDSYFITANHCVSSGVEAATIEFVWDAYTTSCAGPGRQTMRTYGSQLVATSAASDVTLLKVNAMPAGRWLLGWDPRVESVREGTVLYRLSHPGTEAGDNWYQQIFGQTVVDTFTSTCAGKSRPNFIYQRQIEGGAGPGSSGAPVILSGGYIVGQLSAACGPNPSEACSSTTKIVDGAFSASWPTVAPFLNNGPATQPEQCRADSTTLCLNNSRFAVAVSWRDFNGKTGSGNAVSMTGDTGHFWFFDRSNVELVVKVLDGRGLNNRFWVFYGSLSNVEYTLTIRDVETGTVKTYVNRLGSFGSVGDTNAF